MLQTRKRTKEAENQGMGRTEDTSDVAIDMPTCVQHDNIELFMDPREFKLQVSKGKPIRVKVDYTKNHRNPHDRDNRDKRTRL